MSFVSEGTTFLIKEIASMSTGGPLNYEQYKGRTQLDTKMQQKDKTKERLTYPPAWITSHFTSIK